MAEVALRPVEPDDLPALARLIAHPELVGRRGLHDDRPAHRSVGALEQALADLVDPKDGDAWVVESNGIVGLATCGWWWDAHTPWANVVIDATRWRNGFGTTASRLVFDHLFSGTVAHLVQYSVPSWDADALSFADSLGGERAGVRRRTGVRHGRYHDTVEFYLTRERWEGWHGPRG